MSRVKEPVVASPERWEREWIRFATPGIEEEFIN